MRKNTNKRKQVIVKRSLQIKYSIIVLSAVLVTAVTVGGDFYYSLHSFMEMYLSEIPGIEILMNNLNQLMYAKIIVLLIIAVAVSILVSHKFAGPILKMEKSLNEISSGDLTYRMHLRAGDELKNMAWIFNDMVEKFKGWVENDRRIIKEAAQKLESVRNKIENNELRKELEGIRTNLEQATQNWKIEK